MKKPIYLCGLFIVLTACKQQHVTATTGGPLRALTLGVEPEKDGITLKWAPVYFFEEPVYAGTGPAQPATYEIYASEKDENSLQKVAVVAGNIQEYVLPYQSTGQAIYARIKSTLPGFTNGESNVATTNIGQLGTTDLVFPASTPTIIFGSSRGSSLLYAGWNDKWTIRSADGSLRTLIRQGTKPILSPDGRSIAFLGTGNPNSSYSTQLFVETVETQTPQLLDTKQAIFTAEWSNDGKWLAYVASGELWKVSVADRTRVRINTGNWDAGQSQIAWSPDDKFIVAAQERKEPSLNRYITNLMSFPVNGGEPQPLLVSDWRDDQPAFSPDGRYMAFVSFRSGYEAVWVMNRQTGALRQLTDSRESFYYINRLDWLSNSELTYSAHIPLPIDISLRKVTLP